MGFAVIAGWWPEAAINIPWDVWIVTWIAAALWKNRTLKRPGGGREWTYRILEVGGYILLLFLFVSNEKARISGRPLMDFLFHRFWYLPAGAGWAMVLLATAGFAFCWWARLHLGRLWSGRITRKEGHHIIDTGPYAVVRHPIYTGILTAVIATALVKGAVHALIGAALLIVAYWMKARLEERFLREELGAAAYDDYSRRVPMLIPFLKF